MSSPSFYKSLSDVIKAIYLIGYLVYWPTRKGFGIEKRTHWQDKWGDSWDYIYQHTRTLFMKPWYKAVLGIIKEMFNGCNWEWKQSFCSITYRFTVVKFVLDFIISRLPIKTQFYHQSNQGGQITLKLLFQDPNCGLDGYLGRCLAD